MQPSLLPSNVVTPASTHLSSIAQFAFRPIPALLVFVVLWGVFLLVLHPWIMNWGSTPDEQIMPLPGDTPGAPATPVPAARY